jgi:hypothetical protein
MGSALGAAGCGSVCATAVGGALVTVWGAQQVVQTPAPRRMTAPHRWQLEV